MSDNLAHGPDGKWKESIPAPYYHPWPFWPAHARYGCCGPGCPCWSGGGFWTISGYEKHYREAHLGKRPPRGGLKSLARLFQR